MCICSLTHGLLAAGRHGRCWIVDELLSSDYKEALTQAHKLSPVNLHGHISVLVGMMQTLYIACGGEVMHVHLLVSAILR
jgi:hypothetical protein